MRPGEMRPGEMRPGEMRPGGMRPGGMRPGDMRGFSGCEDLDVLNVSTPLPIRGDYIQLSLRTITILLSTTTLTILLHIHLSLHRTFSLGISAMRGLRPLPRQFILLLFTSRYRPALRQVIKWLWFFELTAVVLLAIGFAWLLLADFGREARSGGLSVNYVYRDAEDLGWRMRGPWVWG
ncbi:hypothetical protein VC83_08321 [Pseudogymnoascus destructans]|uniref:Uncharacterized protein n=1 Tax=Pseudogymnoascus destructans TaxID=655981 RepID=A0A176ZZT8_9PEZI|nr:uncharacterized protein VC83_08321 [Pseudogymnoascus destructans]OAF55408.1 hypothetical protein VC83_08321 [Pseudogymnoascus destructans]